MLKKKIKQKFSKFLKNKGYALINLKNTFTTRKELIYMSDYFSLHSLLCKLLKVLAKYSQSTI